MRRNDNYHNYINHYNNQIHNTHIEERRLKKVRDQLIQHLQDFDNASNKNYNNISVKKHRRRCGHRLRIKSKLLKITRDIRDTISYRLLFKEYLDNCPLG